MGTITTIYKILKLLPQIKDLIDGLMVMWFEKQIEDMKKEDREAVRKAIYEFDQRDLEKQIGSTKPGEPSGIPGTEIRPSLPNVGGSNKL